MLRGALIEQGWTDKAIRRLVDAETWAKARHGAYVDGAAWRATDDVGRHEITARAVFAQAKSELVASHITGAVFWDLPLWDIDLSTVDGTRRDGRAGRSEAGVRQHRGKLLPEDIVVRHGVEVVSATRLALELPTVVGLEQSMSLVGSLLHRNETDEQLLAARYGNGMDRWPHSLNTDLMLRLADGRPESVSEHRCLFLCWRQGLPKPIPQYEIRDPEGNVVAVVDFAWPELGVFAEFDGKVKYTRLLKEGESITDVVLREKRREELICELTGWRCIRIIWADLYRPEHTALRLRRLLYRANHVA